MDPDSWGRLTYPWGNQLTPWGLILRVRGDTDADYLLCKQFIRIVDTVDGRPQDLWEVKAIRQSEGPFSISEAGREVPGKVLRE